MVADYQEARHRENASWRSHTVPKTPVPKTAPSPQATGEQRRPAVVASDPHELILKRSVLGHMSDSSHQSEYQQRFAQAMQEEQMYGDEVNTGRLVLRFLRNSTDPDGYTDPQVEREAVLLSVLLQWTGDDAEDKARITAVLSGLDIAQIAETIPDFHSITDTTGETLAHLKKLVKDSLTDPEDSEPLPTDEVPYTPQTVPMHFIGEDGTMQEVNMLLQDFLNLGDDDLQNLSSPIFPIPSPREIHEKNDITIAQTTQGYLDDIMEKATHPDLIDEITPFVKDKIDKIIL